MEFLSIVIPAYNEGLWIKQTIRRMAEYLAREPYRWEMVVVDDGSRDDTVERVKELDGWLSQVRLIRHDANQGKGAAVKSGLQAARGDAILFCDADGATPVEELEKLLPHLHRGIALVTGSRRLEGSNVLVRQGLLRRILADGYQWLCRFLLGLPVADFTCGFKLLSREAAQIITQRMRIRRWSFDAEMFTIAKAHRLKTREVPIQWMNQRQSKVRLRRDLIGSFWELLRIRCYAALGVYR